MTITIQNIPYMALIWIGIGFMILIIGIFMMAYHQTDRKEYTEGLQQKENSTNHIEELFSFFLQEQEEKNEALRHTVKEVYDHTKKEEVTTKEIPTKLLTKSNVPRMDEQIFKQIISLHQRGYTPDAIAKELKIGMGEVQLILSLYTMR